MTTVCQQVFLSFKFSFHSHFLAMNPNLTFLDNPAWWALCDTQHDLSVGNDLVKAYQNQILPFAAVSAGSWSPLGAALHSAGSGSPLGAALHSAGSGSLKILEQWLPPEKPFFIIGDLPELPENWHIEKELPCLQMVWSPDLENAPKTQANPKTQVNPETKANPDAPSARSGPAITILEPKHKMIMYDLVQKVQPGYYEPDSYQLGMYFGIWEAHQLVAMAGERMRLPGMSEVSAVCTHPDFRNRGYAARLTLEVCHYNVQEGRLPFLYVLETNQNAIRLYQALGFQARRIISFWKLGYRFP
jgi:GNAT superfamily N-acetyltransferase